ncbi:MAG TPA: AAA family ATPase [Pirellulales bacterium]|nr:AAA family ATPase [Pirellulales bacterium]
MSANEHSDRSSQPPRQDYKPERWKYCRRDWEPQFYSEEVSLKTMDAVRPAKVAWEADGRLPRGCLTVLAGQHGSGKSLLAVDWTARVSQDAAAEPPADGSPGEAVIAHAGDMTVELLRQRLDAAGAAPERIASLALAGPREGQILSFDEIVERVSALTAAAMGSTHVRLLVVDNVEAWAGNLHREPDSARLGFLLAWLAEVAARSGVAIVALARLPSGARAAMRKLDQLAAAAPVLYLAASDPEQPGRKLLLTVKNNLAPHAPAAALEIVAGRIAWAPAPVEVSAAELLAPSARVEERQERSFVDRWLLAALARGPVASPKLFRQARECGISPKALRRAGKTLGLTPRKRAFDGPWIWQLGADDDRRQSGEDGQAQMGNLGQDGEVGELETRRSAESRRAGGVSLRVGGQSAERGDAAEQSESQDGMATQRHPEANASGSPADACRSSADDSGRPVEGDEHSRAQMEKLGQDGEVGPPKARRSLGFRRMSMFPNRNRRRRVHASRFDFRRPVSSASRFHGRSIGKISTVN